MIETRVENLQGNIKFKYDINSDNDGSGESNFTSAIEMYIAKTSIEYDPNSITTSETNRKTSQVQVLGKFNIILLNKALEESKNVYIKLSGNLNNVFIINKIYNQEYITTEYIMDSYVKVGTVPAKNNNTDGIKEVEVLIGYTGNVPGDNITLQISGYEYEARFHILNMPSIKITATYASLHAVVTTVDSNNIEKPQPVNITGGNSVYYLTEITNIGNTDANSINFSQILDLNHCNITEVKYGYDKNLNKTLSLSGNRVELIIEDKILAYGGKYYVRVQAVVNF